MSEPIANLGALTSLADSFTDVVVFYLAAFSPYHTAFRLSAASIIIPLGILWTSIQVLRFPTQKLATATGSLILLTFCVVLLSPKTNPSAMFDEVTPPANVEIAEGSYWSFMGPKAIYDLFKSALRRAGAGANEAALKTAYDINTKNVAEKWNGSGLEQAYSDYVSKCTAATMREAGTTNNVRALGHVGLHGGSGIGYSPSDHSKILSSLKAYNDVNDNFYGASSSTASKIFAWTPVGMLAKKGVAVVEAAGSAWSADKMASNEQAGREILAAIPESGNPFRDVNNSATSGYKIPTEHFWKRAWGEEVDPSLPDYLDGSAVESGKFSIPGVVEAGQTPETENIAFYPENCLEAYEMSNLGVLEYRKALEARPEFEGKAEAFTHTSIMTNMSELQTAHRLRAQAKNNGQDAVTSNAQAQARDRSFDRMASDSAMSAYAATQSMGAKISEWLLQVKMPFFISTISMLCAALISAFPLFVIISVFLGPGILLTYVKLIVFCFLVILLNETFLSMGANLIAVTTQMDLVYKIGNIARDNEGLELSAATAKVAIFSSLMVIEVIAAKMLIWDDVKALGSFSPGSSGDAAFSTGIAALKTAASVAAAPFAAKRLLASGATKAAANVAKPGAPGRQGAPGTSGGTGITQAVRSGLAARSQTRRDEQRRSARADSATKTGPRAQTGNEPDSGGSPLVPKA